MFNEHFTSASLSYDAEFRTYRNKKVMPQSHYHHHYEILYVYENSRILKIGDNEYMLDKNCVAVIPPYIPHMTISGELLPQSRACINFRPEFIEGIQKCIPINLTACFKSSSPIIAVNAFYEDFKNCIFSLENKALEKTNSPKYLSYSLIRLCELLLLLANNVEPDENHSIDDTFFDIIKYIERNYTSKITLDLLSKEFFLDPYTISRKFNSITGLSIPKYLKTIRIIHAKQMLSSSDTSLTDIAMHCGFSSLVDFDRVFKQDTGFTPLQYRKKTGD